jgi:hypothetical protein
MQNWWTRETASISFKSNLRWEGLMIGKKSEDRPQGFIVILGDCEERPGRNWARMYLSKISGSKKDRYCGPNFLELMQNIQELLMISDCWKVTILTKPYPENHQREKMIREIKKEYPAVNVIYMSYP